MSVTPWTVPHTPVSPKVVAAAAGAGAGAIISSLVLWVVGASAFGAGWSADRVDNAIAAVPSPLAAAILLLITVASAAIPGYQTTDPLRYHPEPEPDENPEDVEVDPETMTIGG